jgi:Kdo2-lipid IVA lauroyltransferase/acyltransferase
MGVIGFYIFYGINWIISLLPLRILYIFSYLIFLTLYYFPTYRKKIVAENLKNAFPEKTSQELSAIIKKFYKHFSDLFVETFKLTHMSSKELKKRFSVSNLEIIQKLKAENRDVIAVCAHYNNWEWMAAVPLYTDYKTISIYKPLKDKRFDRFINHIRSKFGMNLTSMSNIIREIITDRNNGINTLSAFIADQTPAKGDIRYRTQFLNQETPVFLGIEKIASKYDVAVVFFNIQKIRRGYYNLSVELLFEHTTGLPEYFVTNTHVKRLEEIIREKPEYWIWSHRRWKYKQEHKDE